MIGCAITFDAEDVAARLVRMHDADIDPVLRNADLRMRFVAGGFEARQEPTLEVAIWLFPALPSRREGATAGIAGFLIRGAKTLYL
jgi:hypothetical protein